VKVSAQFDNADNALCPNQFVNAQLLVKALHNVVTVPTTAIQRGAPGSYVYVINAGNRVSVRPVNIGPTDGRIAAVNSGVSVGELVVVDDTDRLRDGARVIMPAHRANSGREIPRRTRKILTAGNPALRQPGEPHALHSRPSEVQKVFAPLA
jgi:membrane fusion protein, multidrug efflux system